MIHLMQERDDFLLISINKLYIFCKELLILRIYEIYKYFNNYSHLKSSVIT